MSRINIDIETLTDLELDVQEATSTTGTGENAVKEKCICFTVSGYNSQTYEDVEERVFISIREAQRLSRILASF